MAMEMLMYLGIAMLSALVLIVLAKFVLQYIIRRPADYYEKAEIEQDDMIMSVIREAEKARAEEAEKAVEQAVETQTTEEPAIEVAETETVETAETETIEPITAETAEVETVEPIKPEPVAAEKKQKKQLKKVRVITDPLEIAALFGIRVEASELNGVTVSFK